MNRFVLTCVCLIAAGGGTAAQDLAVPARLSLDEAWRLAESRSPVLAAASDAVARAEAGVSSAAARPNPSLEILSEGYAFSTPAGSSFVNAQELTFKLDQEFDIGGKRRLRTSVAQTVVEAARADLANRRRQLLLDVRRAYLTAVLAQADLETATTTLAEIDRLVTMNRARLEQGEISGVEMRRLQVERFRFADDRFSAELSARNARSTLLALIGVTPLDQRFALADGLTSPGDPPTRTTVPSPDATSLHAASPSTRPDIQAARFDLETSRRDASLQQALAKPNFSVGLGYRRDFGQGGFVLDFNVPLPFFGANPGGAARAAADIGVASARLRATEISASLEVQQARNALDINSSRLAYVETEYLKNAREARDIVLTSYQAGASTLTDYLDAERSLREAQRVRNRAIFEYRLSLFQLDAALGTSLPAASSASGK